MSRVRIMSEIKYNRFDELARRMPDEVEKSIGRVARSTAADMRDRVPVRHGLLKKSIHVIKAEMANKGLVGLVIGIGDRKAYHGHFVEFGTVKMSARPFIEPAVQAGQEMFEQEMNALEERLK